MDAARLDYIKQCKEAIDNIRTTTRFMHRYVLDKKRNRIGVICATRQEGTLFYGWSLCHKHKDTFDRWIGLMKALSRMSYDGTFDEAPLIIQKDVDLFIEMADRHLPGGKKSDDTASS